MSFTIGDVTFDTAIAPPVAINHGHTAAMRAALADDTLIKVRDLATKTNLPAKLTKGLQVTTYNPSDLKDPNNFFNFVSQWEAVILNMETHLKTYFMETPFNIVRQEITAPAPDEIKRCEFDLSAFFRDSHDNGGDADGCDEMSAGGTALLRHVDRPTPPVSATAIARHGGLLRSWHAMTLKDVIEHVTLFDRFVADNVNRQNLSWSFQCIMDCLDNDLKAFVLSIISNVPPNVGRSGPVVFMIVAQRMLQTAENLAQKVINGFIALCLTHFDGESVIEAVFTIRNVLKFLRCGEPNAFAPRTTIVLICDVFRGSTVGAFRNCVQQAQDIVLKGAADPEEIFDHLQAKCEELLLADRWVPNKKKPSVFVLGDPKTRSFVEADKDKDSKPGKDGKDDDKKKKERPTHDKSGKKIDCKAPKPNESHERTVDGSKEFWCGQCGRWGSHPTNKHDEWRKNFRKSRNKKKNGDNGDSANTAGNPSSQSQGSVTFLSAVTRNHRFKVDSDLADGVDFE